MATVNYVQNAVEVKSYLILMAPVCMDSLWCSWRKQIFLLHWRLYL